MPRRRTVLAAFSFAVVPGCSSGGEPGDATATPPPEDVIEILNHEYEGRPDPAVRGELQNTGSQTVSLVTITAKFYDGDGTRIEDWTVNVSDVAPGAVVAFEVPYPDLDTSHRVEEYGLLVDPEKTMY